MRNDRVRSKGQRWKAKSHQGRMHSGQCKSRMNVEEDDRLSSLPDDLIHEILYHLGIKEAIKTSVLSSRWRFIWTSLPYLDFSTGNVSSKFVSDVLRHRDNQIQVSSLTLNPTYCVTRKFVERVLNYAFSHNIQHLTVTCFLKKNARFPLSVVSSRSLKRLILRSTTLYPSSLPTWELPALETLHLDEITLCYENTVGDHNLFSKCTNLKNLYLRKCKIMGTKKFNIFHPRLSNLILQDSCPSFEDVTVVAPQLKNLTITECCDLKHRISAPVFRPTQISIQGFCSVEKVDISFWHPCLEYARMVVQLLQQLHSDSLKCLTLDLEILELISSSKELISHQPTLFARIMSLKFIQSYPPSVCLELRAHEKAIASTETTDYVLHPSPTAIFTEEIKIMWTIDSAYTLMGYIRTSYYNIAVTERENAAVKSHKEKEVKKQWTQSAFKMHWHFGETMALIKQGKIEELLTKWRFGEMMAHIKEVKIKGLITNLPTTKICDMISSLLHIERLVAELPESKRAVIQATFSNLCEEAAILLTNMFDGTKSQYVSKPWC